MVWDMGIARAGTNARKQDYFWRQANVETLDILPQKIEGEVVGIVGTEDCGVKPQNADQVTGIRLRVRLSNGTICRPLYRGDYSQLRSVHGTDDCLIGKACIIDYIGSGLQNVSNGIVDFSFSSEKRYANESKVSNITTTGPMYGSLFENPGAFLANFQDSDSKYTGE